MNELKPGKLFVYGTLRKGGIRSRHLEQCRLLEMIKVPGTLYRTPFGYPAAVFDEESSLRVVGELYDLPAGSELFIRSVDRLEGISENLFSRTTIRFGEDCFYSYEPGIGLRRLISDTDIIKSGNWFSSPSLCGEDPFCFAVAFEDIQRQYYRMPPEESGEENIFLEGSLPVLITCPHSTAHTRMGKLKRHEFYTAALGATAHMALGCHCLYSNREQESDPNYYDDCGFKNILGEILSRMKIGLVIDIHGTGNQRPEDLFPGVGTEGEFLLSSTDILSKFYLCAKRYGISAGSAEIFPATMQMTVAKFAAKRFSVPAIQIEISDRLRMPWRREEEFRQLIGFLLEFISELVPEKRAEKGDQP
ncbi:MAG: gamma-glutamylcyclotransferase [Candidatus Dadabacteria bacterium]|nr:gamma-glutamylcyclotransferase [Candidatus Dadabacteria bacterium]